MVTRHMAPARGFTLIEMMVTLGIVAVLAAVGVPTIKEMTAKQRVRNAAADLSNTLMRARSFSVKLQTNVTVTPVNAAKWNLGWSVPDPTATGVYLFDARNAILRTTVAGPASVVYKSNGRPVTPSTAFFNVSGEGTTEKWCIKLELSGLPYKKKGTC